MDVTPPQAPPAHIQNVYQHASEAFDRVVALQAWLATEQAGIPAIPEVGGAGALAPYLLAIDAYWGAAPTNGSATTSRRAEVARRIATAARDLAVLAHQDGTLDPSGLALVAALTSGTGGDLPAHLKVRELLFGQVVYAGVLLVQDDRVPDHTLVFSNDRGWESFPRRVDAHAEMERRARSALVLTPDLPGIARQDLASIGADAFVDSRDIAGNPFGVLVDRLIGVQHDKLRQAWFEFSLADQGDASAQALRDAGFDILRLDSMFDVEHVLAIRHATLLQTTNELRLERVPQEVGDDWRSAESAYRSALNAAAVDEATTTLSAPLSLPAYASAAIAERLRALGITHDPADILVRIDRSTDLAARLESLQALFEGPTPEHIKLVDLAYQNIAAFDPSQLSAHASDGTIIAELDDAAIRRLVRGLDLSSGYQAYVDATFRTGNGAAMRRDQAARLQSAHMRLLAAEARLSYYLDDTPRSFLPDRAERGYRWVKAALDAPVATSRARVEGHEVVVRQITYLGTPLRDILAFGVRHPSSVASVVLYTPDAPDGLTFREFVDRAEAGRQFFYHPAFREYLLDRLPAEYSRTLPNGSSRDFAGDNLANWVLGSSSTTAHTRTQAPFDEQEVSGDFLDATYEVDVQLGLRNVQAFTRSAERANWTWLVERLGTTMTHRIVEDAIKGVVTAPARAAQAAWRFYDNVKAGDNPQAFVDFADFYNTSLSVAMPAYALGSTSVAHAIAGARFRTATARIVEARPAVRPTVVFEPRFVARNVRKTGQADRDGILTIQGKTYIDHHGQLYRVVYDRDYATWRLSRPETTASVGGPAIQRTSAGTWAYRRVGLRGGSGRGQAGNADRLPDLYDELQAEVELAFPDPVELELVATRVRFERTPYEGPLLTPPPLISPAQRLRWSNALNRARTRQAQRAAPPGSAVPADLTLRYGRYRSIPRTEAPAELWYYDNRPFQTSTLVRARGTSGYINFSTSRGYSHDVAEITSGLIERELYGIRLTSVPPTAQIAQINDAMGVHHITRSGGFAVRVDPNSLYEPLSPFVISQQGGGGVVSNAVLLAPNGGPANVFIAHPIGGGPLRLGRGQFEVTNRLPPPGPR